jgi:hypothetical protein
MRADATTDATRVAARDWPGIAAVLDEAGCAIAGPLLTAEACVALGLICHDAA